MTKPNHTPTPWHTHDRVSNGIFIRTNDKYICAMSGDIIEQNANAALIVKAVNGYQSILDDNDRLRAEIFEAKKLNAELVEALEKCRTQFDYYVSLHSAKNPPDMDKAASNQEFVELCEAALAKAGAA